jgi:hypothetical protein
MIEKPKWCWNIYRNFKRQPHINGYAIENIMGERIQPGNYIARPNRCQENANSVINFLTLKWFFVCYFYDHAIGFAREFLEKISLGNKWVDLKTEFENSVK